MSSKLTTKEVAELANIDPSAVRYHIRNNNIYAELLTDYPVAEGGPQYRFYKKDVLKFLEDKYNVKKKEFNSVKEDLEIIKNGIVSLKEE